MITMRALSAASLLAALTLLAGAASAQGVLARGDGGELVCIEGGIHTHVGARCEDVPCELPRVCLALPGLGARCVDRASEIACFPTTTGCDACPMISTGADPEDCRVVELASGPHALCFYGVEVACLGEAMLDVAACLPDVGGEPGIAAGDCDADGVTNAADLCLCEGAPGSSDGCPFDAGTPIDAQPPDAGTTDGGPLDAGPFDASLPFLDAESAFDAEAQTASRSFRGGGGCSCRAAAASRSTWSVSVLLALTLLRRRDRVRSRS